MTKTRKTAVLFSSAGRRVELINCFRADAQALGVELEALACDVNPAMSAACRAADEGFAVPRCDHPDFISRMLELCARKEIRLVVPTIDTELEILAANKARFLEAGTQVAVSSPEVVALARDKMKTAQFLDSCGVPSPRTARLSQFAAQAQGWRFPVILKPVGGSSSIGIHSLSDAAQLAALRITRDDYIAQEQCLGQEYTVNLFFDKTGALRCAVSHQRSETRGGEVSKGQTRRLPSLAAAAKAMAKKLSGAYGALCFQAIVDAQGKASIFEINARFGGGFPLAHRAKAAFSRWLLEDILDLPSTANDQWREGVLMLRYDAAVFAEAEKTK